MNIYVFNSSTISEDTQNHKAKQNTHKIVYCNPIDRANNVPAVTNFINIFKKKKKKKDLNS